MSSSQRAFSDAVAQLSRDMPILMHGSGDVLPHQVNPDTVRVISELTVGYIQNLVDAALDAQVLLAGGPSNVRPPPPRYPRSRQPPLPSLLPVAKKDDNNDSSAEDGSSSKIGLWKKRPRRPDVEYWDEPLPEPKIVKRVKTTETTKQSSSVGFFAGKEEADSSTKQVVHVDQWVGAAGVDLFEESRSRAAHVQMPDALGVQCFIFPICHDGFLYGKVMQVQASRRAIAPVLVDKVLLDLVQKEGALALRHAPRRKKKGEQNNNSKKKKDSLSGDADVMEDEPEQDEEEEEAQQDDEPTWPGLEFLLPVHAITEASATRNNTSSIGNKLSN